jgi:hypothetical protein
VIVNVDPFDSPPTGTTRRFFEEDQALLEEVNEASVRKSG